MQRPAAPRHPHFSLQLLAAGVTASAVTLAILLSLGLLVYAPAGADAGQLGLGAVLATCVVAVPLFALLARCALPFGGPSSATAIVLAALVARVVQVQPQASWATLAVAVGAAVVGMGLLQLAMGLLRLGRLVGWVPQPVLSGFMNGVALHVVLSQWPVVKDVQDRPAALALALGTAGFIWLLARRLPRAPAPLVGLALGTLLYQAWPALQQAAGPALQTTEAALPLLLPLAWPHADLAGLWPHIALTAVLLALTGSLEALVSLRALDLRRGERSNANRMLLAAGAANLAGGLAGALPLTLVRTAAIAVSPSGAHGPKVVLLAAGLSTLVFALASPAIGWVPQAVVAGVMLTIGVALADHWSRGLLRRVWREPRQPATLYSLAVVTVVGATTAFVGTAPGIALGVVLAAAAVMRGMRGQLIRARADGRDHPSRRVWPPADEALLAPLRAQIQVIELQGALFFASTERVLDACDDLPPACRHLVLDLRRVSTIDDSGATMLQQLRSRLAQRGVALHLASVDRERARGRRLAAFGGAPDDGWHSDADRAIEAAERALLATLPARGAPSELPLADSALLRGLCAADAAFIQARTGLLRLAAGERLFRHGDAGDTLYVVTRGSISVQSADGQHRFTSFSPGTVFGEMAVLDGAGRTADAVADTDTELRSLSAAELARLQADRPALAAQLYRNLALHLAQRLRVASSAWQAAAR